MATDGAALSPALRLLLAVYRSRASGFVPPSVSDADANAAGTGAELPDPALFDTHELVAAGRVGPTGVRLTLRVVDARDLERTVMRSDAASLSLPALKVDNPDGTGRFASVRDVLRQMRDGVEQGLSFAGQLGSAQGQHLLRTLRDYASATTECVLVLDDPLGVSRISPRPDAAAGNAKGAKDAKDAQLTREEYARSWEQCEDFGLHMRHAVDPALQRAQSTVHELARLIGSAKRVVAFTGAGISTESGIPAFWIDDKERQLRSVWNTYPHDKFTEPNLTTNSDIRTAYWAMTYTLFASMQRAQPNAAHRFFAALHAARHALPGHSVTVITQNIDALHTRAGVPRDRVRELHGCMWTVTCRACGRTVEHTGVHARIAKGETDPRCTATVPVPAAAAVAAVAAAADAKGPAKQTASAPVGAAGSGAGAGAGAAATMTCGGVLLPDVVHFGAALNDALLATAQQDVRDADLLIGIGSSFFVAPANALPGQAILQRTPFVLLNKTPTKFDAFACVRMDQPCAEVLAEVQRLLGIQPVPLPDARPADAKTDAAKPK